MTAWSMLWAWQWCRSPMDLREEEDRIVGDLEAVMDVTDTPRVVLVG